MPPRPKRLDSRITLFAWLLALAGAAAVAGWLFVRADPIGRQTTTKATAGAPAMTVTQTSPQTTVPPGQIDIDWLPDTVTRHRPHLIAAAARHRVDPELLAIVTLVESGGYTRATSPSGARGLMQVMPATGKVIAAQRSLQDHTTERLYDPAHNVDFGAWYLSKQLRAFATEDQDETVELAAAAYNGGPGRLQRYLADGGTLSNQTIRYRHWVRNMWDERRGRQSAAYSAWYEAGGHRLVDLARAERAGKFTR